MLANSIAENIFSYVSLLTNISSSFCHRPLPGNNKLVSIYSNFCAVVDESKEWSQGEGCHKDGDEAVVDHQLKVLKEEAVFSEGLEVVVLLVPGVCCSQFFPLE